MSLTADVLRLVAGLFAGMIIPRLPLLFFTRFLNMERSLSPHPDPITVDVPLIQRMLLMRRVHWMGWALAVVPLGFGLLMLRASAEPFALGMVAGVAWFAISRTVPQHLGNGLGILPMSLVKDVNNLREVRERCCDRPFPQWEVRAVRCRHCRSVLLNRPRPDFGRVRADGRLAGAFRVLLSDGGSPFPPLEEEE